MLDAKSAKVTETKVVKNFETYSFAFVGLSSAVQEFGEKCKATKPWDQILGNLTEAGNIL